ncbi:MAG: hypothetical protein ACKOJF_31790, partial [Planctomycetaceae bacterium]
MRLALFAEIFKHRPWTPAELLEVRGAEGVGRVFLEETFQADQAQPRYRRHAGGAQRVLTALLPEVGSDITGPHRTEGELIEAAGYSDRPEDVQELLQILDQELRLISPVADRGTEGEGFDDGGAGTEGPRSGVSTARHYHLTHDYLVPSLRAWVEDLLVSTPAGRAKRLLQERSRMWNARPQDRQLPTLGEHLQIRRWTKAAERTEPERRMLSRVAMVHGRGTALFMTLLLGLTLVGWWLRNRQAQTHYERGVVAQVAQLETAQPSDWARVRAPLAEPRAREVARRELDNVFAAATAGGRGPTVGERIARLTIGDDRTQLEPLREALLTGPLPEFLPTREPLEAYRAELVEPLWRELRNEQGAKDRRLRAGMALAGLEPSQALSTAEEGQEAPPAWTAADAAF